MRVYICVCMCMCVFVYTSGTPVLQSVQANRVLIELCNGRLSQRAQQRLSSPDAVVDGRGRLVSGWAVVCAVGCAFLVREGSSSSFLQQSFHSSTPSPSPLFPTCINLNWLQSSLNSLLSTAPCSQEPSARAAAGSRQSLPRAGLRR